MATKEAPNVRRPDGSPELWDELGGLLRLAF